MTEEEAKQKWCPFARELFIHNRIIEGPGIQGFDFAAGYNRGEGKQSTGSKCFGSGCMAWRWQGRPHKEGDVMLVFDDGGTVKHTSSFDGDGYCGLAGNPCQ